MADVLDSSAAAALFKKRKSKTNVRKRPATPPPASDSEYSSEDDSGIRVKKKRRKAGMAVQAAASQAADVDGMVATKYQANRSTTIAVSDDATKQSSWFEEPGDKKKDISTADGTYKGASGYSSYIQKNPNGPNKQVGPIKAPTNVRTITMMDYKPDICKDYAKTGYCGFGDSCIFLHDRADWQQGWQIDKEWEIQTKGKKLQGTTVASVDRGATKEERENEEEAKLLESIPFACKICEEPYKKPTIQTRCGHYFCEKCALERYKKNPTCAVCGSGTNGVFNNAKNLNKLLDKKREREKRRKEKEEQEKEEEAS